MIDVEHGALSAFKKHRTAFIQRTVHKRGGVDNQRPQALGIFEILFSQTLDFERHSIGRAANSILLRNDVRQLFTEAPRLQQITNT